MDFTDYVVIKIDLFLKYLYKYTRFSKKQIHAKVLEILLIYFLEYYKLQQKLLKKFNFSNQDK